MSQRSPSVYATLVAFVGFVLALVCILKFVSLFQTQLFTPTWWVNAAILVVSAACTVPAARLALYLDTKGSPKDS